MKSESCSQQPFSSDVIIFCPWSIGTEFN